MWLGYAALVSDDAHNFMRSVAVELYERWGAQASSTVLEPHVTIKQPFEGELEVAAEYLDELAARVEPFELVLDGYAEFENEGVVFLDVVGGAERIMELQRQVLDELGLEPAAFESGEPEPYHVHATLAVGLQAPQRQAAIASLPEPPRFAFTVERLGLFARVEAGWLVYRRAGLG